MLYSLRFGLLLAMLAVAAVAITTVTIFVGMTTRAQFERYVEIGRELRQERMERAVVEWVDPKTTIPDLESLSSVVFLTENSQLQPGSFHIRMLEDLAVIEELDPNMLPKGRADDDTIALEVAPSGEMLIYRGQDVIGTMFIDPISNTELEQAQADFMESINWTLLATAFVAAVAAITLTVILSRRILHPVAALTLAAQRMEEGDLDQRVKVHASGEIEELAHAFNAMAETLSRTETLRRNMVSDIAHELRTPLTNIRGYLEAIQDGVLEPNTNTIDMLHDEALLLNQLIQDLQELTLAESGALRYEVQEINLDLLVEQTFAALQTHAIKKQIQLRMNFPNDMPSVLADQRRVAQVLRNLINNAITHTPIEGCIQITAEIFPNEVEINVIDSGEGIDAQHLPYLFERFYRVDPSRSRATGGAGLGLAIVKNLIEAQGGRVQVNSVKDKGTTFSFTLPRYASIH